MSDELHLSASDRVLVLAPHPDDETLAAGDLIRSVLAAGAGLRIVFATDGDNNPWPQRWIEKRWRIGPRERARWGARRRREAVAALARLGVPEPAAAARFLGWPDQGLTGCLMHGDACLDELAREISAWAPTHLVMPVLRDRHPDHSALHVMAELALLRSGVACRRLAYLVHGEVAVGSAVSVPVSDARAKRNAMEAYVSQLTLSRQRLLGIAARPNRFEAVQAGSFPSAARELRLARARSVRRHDLLLLLAWRERITPLRSALTRRGTGEVTIDDGHGRSIGVAFGHDEVRIRLPPDLPPPAAVFAKLHRRDPRVLIFDSSLWQRDGALLIFGAKQDSE